MPEFPDETENREKDMIIARCPYLRAFMDDYAEKDFDMWQKMVEKELVVKRDEIILEVGVKKADKDLNVYYRVSEEYRIFNPDYDKKTKGGLVLSLLYIGYEIGKAENVALFTDDVTTQLLLLGALNKNNVTDPRDYIKEIMKCGVLWKKELGDDLQDVWKNAIEKLDYD